MKKNNKILMVECNICGREMPICDMSELHTVVSMKDTSAPVTKQQCENVCSKCLPNLLAMLECAVLKTIQIIRAENEDGYREGGGVTI